MKARTVTVFALLVVLALAGCASRAPDPGWITLIEGESGLENFERSGDANWRAEGGAIVADRGRDGYLLTRHSYRDFEIRAEFWAEATTNSGIFIRASDPGRINPHTSYEVNIYDRRPGQEYATGAIVGLAAVPLPIVHRAGGRWNRLEIRARGPEITVRLNGTVTVSLHDNRHAAGPVALQFAAGLDGTPGGVIKWRSLRIRPL